MSSNPAFQALINLSNVSRSSATGLPAQQKLVERWSGIGFSLMGEKFVVPLGQVAELMEVPESTRLPGVKSWVIGLSNVRGRLLPLFDLAHFMGGDLGTQKKSQRVLVIDVDGLYSGLVVEKAFGMQHFAVNSFDSNMKIESDSQNLPFFLEGGYQDSEGDNWSVFDISKLSKEPLFTNAADI